MRAMSVIRGGGRGRGGTGRRWRESEGGGGTKAKVFIYHHEHTLNSAAKHVPQCRSTCMGVRLNRGRDPISAPRVVVPDLYKRRFFQPRPQCRHVPLPRLYFPLQRSPQLRASEGGGDRGKPHRPERRERRKRARARETDRDRDRDRDRERHAYTTC